MTQLYIRVLVLSGNLPEARPAFPVINCMLLKTFSFFLLVYKNINSTLHI